MLTATDTVLMMTQEIPQYIEPTLGIKGTDRNFNSLYVRYKKQLNLVTSREVLRLMQLGFLESFR